MKQFWARIQVDSEAPLEEHEVEEICAEIAGNVARVVGVHPAEPDTYEGE